MKSILGKFRRLMRKRSAPSASIYMRDNPAFRKYSIGEFTYGSPIIKDWGEGSTLRIGKFCSISKGVTVLLGGNHRTDWVSTYPFQTLDGVSSNQGRNEHSSKGDINIGNDVWLGLNSMILSGVSIGNGAVVAAGALVTRSVPSYAIVGGNPAVILRYRFSEEQIRELEGIRWWDWPNELIKANQGLILSDRISDFIAVGKGIAHELWK